jgi:hypothetical protein
MSDGLTSNPRTTKPDTRDNRCTSSWRTGVSWIRRYFYFWVVLTAVFAAAGATHIALAITYSELWPVWVALVQLLVAGGCARAAVYARP